LNLRNSETKEPVENSGIPAMVDNWIRLGLATVDYMSALIAPDSYNWVEGRPEFIRLRTTHENETKKLSFEKGVLERTTLGKQFATVVGILPKGEA
jgi:hypothetical protein